eukprot:6440497-Prymnesium_polylepis.2
MLPQVVCARAAAEAVPRCPTCREPIGAAFAESGAQVAAAPTFVMPAAAVSGDVATAAGGPSGRSAAAG